MPSEILSMSFDEILRHTSNVFLRILEDLFDLPEENKGEAILNAFISENRLIYIGILIIVISMAVEIVSKSIE